MGYKKSLKDLCLFRQTRPGREKSLGERYRSVLEGTAGYLDTWILGYLDNREQVVEG